MRTTKLIVTAVLAAGLCAGQARGEAVVSAGTGGYWTNTATWSPGKVPTLDDDVAITNGCTVTMNDMVTREVKSLTIDAGGVLAHTAHTYGGESYKVVLNVVNDLTIDGQINVDAKGFPGDGYGNTTKCGPGYGGQGTGASYGGTGDGQMPTYGSITAPTNSGSGGGAGGGSGGGVAWLNVGGLTTVNGMISAQAGTDGYGSGAGGSVWLTTGTLSGNGTIRAQGGAGWNPGGGGRIAVILTNGTSFGSITMSACSATYSGRGAAAGTIYRQHKDHSPGCGILIVDAGNIMPHYGYKRCATWQNGGPYSFSEIILTNGGCYGLLAGDTLDISGGIKITGDPSRRTDGIYLKGGTLIVPADFVWTNYFIGLGATNSTLSGLTSLTVGSGATLKVDWQYTLNCPVTVASGGIIDQAYAPALPPDANNFRLDLTINSNLTILAGGAVNVDKLGFPGDYYGNTTKCGPGWGGANVGATHGGCGDGNSTKTYGSITSPTNNGSGGGYSGGDGGGAARLNVAGLTTLDGMISAQGGNASSGSGAGGSVWLTTGTLTGSGTIRAQGGNGSNPAGGGRIAVILTNGNSFGNVAMQAFPQPYGSSTKRAAAGTIYRQTKDQGSGNGTLIVDGNNETPDPNNDSNVTLISDMVRDTMVGSVIITNKAKLSVVGQTLTVLGDWSNAGTTLGSGNGTVVFGGTNAAVIAGHNVFQNLTCTNAGKTLSFQDDATNTVNGTLTLNGPTLNSISGGQWYLKASPSSHSVSNVTVSRSDARPGSAVEAFASVNGGYNYNWVFAESGFRTNYWTGTEDSDWTKPGNWSRGRSTQLSDTVVVTNGSPNYPLLQSATRILALAVSNGATLGLTNYNLVVDDDVRVAGTLTASGTEKLTIGGDLDFTGGTFNAATSTVWIAGSNAQTVVSDGKSFRNLSISNSAASVMFTDAVSATNIVNYSTPVTFGGAVAAQTSIRTLGTNVIFGGAVTTPSFYNETGALVFSGTVATVVFTNQYGDLTFRDDFASDRFYCAPGGMDLTFESGKTYTFGTLLLYGRANDRIRLLASSAASWNLNVTGSHVVRLVDVEYSNAGSGQKIYPWASTDSDHNDNWDFGGPWRAWAGGTSSSFTNDSNWDPAGAPDASIHVLIDADGANAPVLSNATTVGRVTVGGGLTSPTLTVNVPLTVQGDMLVHAGAVVTHSAHTSGGELYKCILNVGSNLTVDGQISVDAKGFPGDGYGNTTKCGPGYGGQGAGGTHGGRGENNTTITYGSITAPTNSGSGGGAPGGNGGGVAWINVGGLTTVNGMISAQAGNNGYGSGAGGSVWLTTGTLSGNGTIRAQGGTGWDPGGGGRISVILTNSADFDGVAMEVFPQWDSNKRAAAGTVYLRTSDQLPGRGTLIVDACNRSELPDTNTKTTQISDTVRDTTVGTVIVTNMAKLSMSNATLTVQGNWIVAADAFFIAANGTVDFPGTNTATIYANSTFFNLTCTNAGKTLSFEAGRTNTVTGLLKLGASQPGQMVTLQSTTNGSWSYLTLVSGGTQAIARVNVKDNNASGGQLLVAGGGSANGGNNINWQFPPSGTMFMVK